MSVRESIRVFHPVDIEQYLTVLKNEFGAQDHPHEPNSYIVDTPPLPFCKPQRMEDETVAIVGFNYLPLSATLLIALINHPELAPETTEVTWTIEQDLFAHGTLYEFKQLLANDGLYNQGSQPLRYNSA